MFKDKEGNVVVQENKIMERWQEYCEDLLNRPNPTRPVTIEDAPCTPSYDLIQRPTRDESFSYSGVSGSCATTKLLAKTACVLSS